MGGEATFKCQCVVFSSIHKRLLLEAEFATRVLKYKTKGNVWPILQNHFSHFLREFKFKIIRRAAILAVTRQNCSTAGVGAISQQL